MAFRVSAVQYHLHTISSFEEFSAQCEHYIKTAEEYSADFILFPEFLTTQLMSIGDEQGKAQELTTCRSLPAATGKCSLVMPGSTVYILLAEPTYCAEMASCTMWRISFIRMEELPSRPSCTLHLRKLKAGIWGREKGWRYSRPIKAPSPC